MRSPDQTAVQNRLLRFLSPDDFARLAPHLEAVDLPKGFILADTDGPIEHVYFPDIGITSMVSTSPEGHEVETGLYGRDGMGPATAVLGADRMAAHRSFIQVPGHGHRIPRPVLAEALDDSVALRALLLRFAQVQMVQTAFTALSNAVHVIEERLARWLLMCHDRVDGDEVALTHEFLSIMLAVRRPGVTSALHVLEGNRFIRGGRGLITIRDRKGLEEFAHDAYGRPEAEYERLIGPMN